MAHSVKRPTSAQVMISRFVSSGPMSGSVLTTQSLEPASDSVSLSRSAPTPLLLFLSLSLSRINKTLKILRERSVSGGEKEKEREREGENPKQAPCCQHKT